MKTSVADILLRHSAALLLVIALLGFSLGAPTFLDSQNLANILTQASATVILAVGMTFVLLVAGVDLSVGSAMYVGAGVTATLLLNGFSLWIALPVFLLIGAGFGGINAFFIARLGIMPFIVTLAMLFVGRGVGLLVTETRSMNLPASFVDLGSARVLGLPMPILVAIAVVAVAHLILVHTSLGKQIYAVGHDAEMARKAGIQRRRVLTFCYLITGICAAISGFVALAQLGAVAPNFGYEREFVAIAAAVMGGASLFGGRGNVFPGTVIGALLLQTTQSGLVSLNVDPYLYPVIYAGIIFFAVATDTLRRSVEGKKK